MSKLKSDYKWEIVLYPDSLSYEYADVLMACCATFDKWAYITHNRDLDDDGVPIKDHTHFIGSREKSLTPESVSYMTGAPISALANIRFWRASVRYLIHMDQPEKAQYEKDDIKSNIDLKQYLRNETDDDLQAERIFYFIKDNYTELTMPKLTAWVIENHLWAAYRRGFAVWSKLLRSVENEDRRKTLH